MPAERIMEVFANLQIYLQYSVTQRCPGQRRVNLSGVLTAMDKNTTIFFKCIKSIVMKAIIFY